MNNKFHTIKIKAGQLMYRGEVRLKVIFDYNVKVKDYIKTIEGSRWSVSFKCWHLPYNQVSINSIVNTFKHVIYLDKQTEYLGEGGKLNNYNKILFYEADNYFYLKLPYFDRTQSMFLHKLSYSRNIPGTIYWKIRVTEVNRRSIKKYFGENVIETPEIMLKFLDCEKKKREKSQIHIYTDEKYIRLLFHYHEDIIKYIKTIPYRRYDAKNRWWIIPYSVKILNQA